MSQFIILTTCKDTKVAIKIEDIIYLEEHINTEDLKYPYATDIHTTNNDNWHIKESVTEIVKRINTVLTK